MVSEILRKAKITTHHFKKYHQSFTTGHYNVVFSSRERSDKARCDKHITGKNPFMKACTAAQAMVSEIIGRAKQQ